MFSRVPPAKKIADALQVDHKVALRIRRILKGSEDPRTVDQTDQWVRACYHEPRATSQALHAADVLAGTHGVEGVSDGVSNWPVFEYLNTGDSYASTLVRIGDRIEVSSWAGMVESLERQGRHFE